MSEQAKRAQEVWDAAWEAFERDYEMTALDDARKAAEAEVQRQRRHRKWALQKARLYHDCSEHFGVSDVERLRSERDAIQSEWDKWVLENKTWITERAKVMTERDALEKRVREWQAENSVLRGLLQKGTVDRGSFTQYVGEATVKTPQELDPDYITRPGAEEVKS